MKHILQKRPYPIFYIALCFAMICWLFLFGQLFAGCFLASQKAVPAFLSGKGTEDASASGAPSMLSCPVSLFGNDAPDPASICHFLKQYDSGIRLVSCHREKNYTDIYLYSPLLKKRDARAYRMDYNMQAAVTDDTVYFGTPFLQYDF